MKYIKLLLGLGVGIGVGIGMAVVLLLLFTDIPLVEILDKFATVSVGKMAFSILLSLVVLMVALLVQIILHEGGHLLFGLLTGYRFVSFRIFHYTLLKEEGKFRIKRFDIAGTGGQCLLSPPEVAAGEYIPYFWYNVGGGILNLLGAFITLPIWLWVDDLPVVIDVFLLLFSLVGVLLALTNLIPFKIGGITNDGANLVQMWRNPSSRTDLAVQLRINAAVQEGIRPKELTDAWFVEKTDLDYSNVFEVMLQLFTASRYMDLFQYDKAHRLFEQLMQHKEQIVGLLVKEITCELLFLELKKGGDAASIETYYDAALQEYVKSYSKVMSSKQRLLFAFALYKERNLPAAQAIYEQVKQRQASYLMKGEVLSDLAIMEDCLANYGANVGE